MASKQLNSEHANNGHSKKTSPPVLDDASADEDGRACAWCRNAIIAGARADSIFCGRACRQAAWRIRQRRLTDEANRRPMRFAYADPPFPGMAALYRDQPTYAGEVDHAALVSLLEEYDGCALSTSARSLVKILPLFKREFRLCPWVKPIGVSGATFGIHNAWEPLIVVPGRALRPGKRDWLRAQPAKRGGSKLIGRKPEAFAVWLFELLGMLPGDSLDDLFPGSGIIGRAWKEVCRG
jgi:hypothetical protein